MHPIEEVATRALVALLSHDLDGFTRAALAGEIKTRGRLAALAAVEMHKELELLIAEDQSVRAENDAIIEETP